MHAPSRGYVGLHCNIGEFLASMQVDDHGAAAEEEMRAVQLYFRTVARIEEEY